MRKPFFNQYLKMDSFSIKINPQYVRLTDELEMIDGKERRLHEVQKRIKLDFEQLPEFTIITAPTGTGKSYAFPFPVLNAKKQPADIDSEYEKVRGLIVLPTNALISELTASFRKTYEDQGLTVNQLTGPELDKHQVKGHDRWKKAIEIAVQSDLVITNPDLINYAMHGGYHQWAGHNKTGATRFSAFLDKFNYIIFDEYHLYDEAQIANILTLARLREFFLPNYKVGKESIHGVRFLFVSATPEEGLKKIFESEGYEYEEIVESIVSEGEQARAIHGSLEVEFTDCKDIKALIRLKIPELREILKTRRVLLILDKLRDVQEIAEELRSIFQNYTIYQSTGYVSKLEDHNEKISAAHLIIATNKAEVGVNYDVEYCIMQPGRYFQNFVQRFGRISRGDLDGKVVIGIDQKYGKIKRLFRKNGMLNYYDFLDVMRGLLQGRAFYEKRVPAYVGEYLWCIQRSIRRYQEYDVWRYLGRRMDEEGFFQSKVYHRYRLFQEINKKVNALIEHALRIESVPTTQKRLKPILKRLEKTAPHSFQWFTWWDNYLDTYLTFRDGSKVVKIYDRVQGEELSYSLDWILQHKVVEQIEVIQTEPFEIVKYTVGNLKERDKDIQYTVSTLPNAGMTRNNLLSYDDIFELDKVFKRSVERIYDKVKKGDERKDELQVALCQELIHLASTFDRKRLKIEAIDSNDPFL
jgi:CRISPR-associated endonuclease/helicase Cas3